MRVRVLYARSERASDVSKKGRKKERVNIKAAMN